MSSLAVQTGPIQRNSQGNDPVSSNGRSLLESAGLGEKADESCCVLQIHSAPELALFCEGFFLKHMSSLLDQDSFKQLIYGRNSKVQGLDPLQDLQATLASRLHSIYITSRV